MDQNDVQFTREEVRDLNHRKSRTLILWCAVIGAVFAFVVSPIPCVAWPVLLAIEVYMLISIVKVYGYRLTQGLIAAIFIVLLGVSAILSIVITELVSVLTVMVAAPVIKPLVAGLVIWGLGEAGIYVMDKQVIAE